LAREFDRRLHVERSLLPAHLAFVVLEARIEAEREKTAGGEFAAADVVEIIRGAMREHEGDVRPLRPVGMIERGAQTAQRDVLRMALRESRSCSGDSDEGCGGKERALERHGVVPDLVC